MHQDRRHLKTEFKSKTVYAYVNQFTTAQAMQVYNLNLNPSIP